MLHRLILFTAALAAVVAACTVDKSSNSEDDDETSTSNTASSSTGPNPTETCVEQCQAVYPNGFEAYNNVRLCMVCWACGTVCDSEHATAICADGVGESPVNCSAQFPTCKECIESACALDQLPDTTFMGVCTDIAYGCSNNVECVKLQNCVYDCVAAGTTSSSTSASTTAATTSTGGM